jgi:hypothetical protein
MFGTSLTYENLMGLVGVLFKDIIYNNIILYMLSFQQHDGGLFSCFSTRLRKILEYFNDNKQCPSKVDSSKLFNIYKIKKSDDISEYLFKTSDLEIPYENDISIVSSEEEDQFSSYKKLNFNDLKPFIEKYFKPTEIIQYNKTYLINKYNVDTTNTCSVFFRGNDKARETNTPSYEDFIKKAEEIKELNPNIRFLLQTDEIEFSNAFKNKFEDTIIFTEIPQINKSDTSVQYVVKGSHGFDVMMFYFASVLIMSETKYIISTSGNGEMWLQLYRGVPEGLIQYLNRKEYIYGVKNMFYKEGVTDFWIY